MMGGGESDGMEDRWGRGGGRSDGGWRSDVGGEGVMEWVGKMKRGSGGE